MKYCHKKWYVFLTILLCAGCSLLPKPVELGAKKVKPVPEASVADQEVFKQAADLASRKAEQTVLAATLEGSSSTVLVPAKETAGLTRSVALSVGPPEAQWKATADALSARLDAISGRLDRRVEEYRRKIEPMVGKTIEGTGWLQVPYLVWVGGMFVLGLVVWTGIKILGVAYPPVGAGACLVASAGRASGAVLSKAVGQVVAGGKAFTKALDQSGLEASVVARVKTMFESAQDGAQDANVKVLIKPLT